MNFYVQYHNVENEGLILADPPFTTTRLSIHTSRAQVQHAEGQVFLIAGIGRPRRYFLWQSFEIEKVAAIGDGEFRLIGTGSQMAPPIELSGKPFDEFKTACANFVAFRCINGLPFTRTLNRFAETRRPPGKPEQIVKFLNTLDGFFDADDPARSALRTALGHFQPVRALSIRQPHAEAIMRGVKKIEYRSTATRIRGRVFISTQALAAIPRRTNRN